MTGNKLIPTAQYLRMSTEHQQYSLDNQITAIQKYAESHSFEIVRTYHDAAKSGVSLKRRTGLQQLLQDVVAGGQPFRAILVYDVSRWGRFQDTDESAHYEFLCKSAGVPIHYCAETFANDGSLPNLIMKALKRTMAGEYSRELGVKVLAGQKRLASLGFKQGGVPGYGLRRMLISPEGVTKQELASGERKSIATDRVIFVPGPPSEIECVKDIYRMLISEKRSVYAIVRELNRRGIPYLWDSKWYYSEVYAILTHPKYTGCLVFGRTSQKLYTPAVSLPQSEWTMTPGAFRPIVDAATFEQAQKILKERTTNRSDEEILDELRKLLISNGRLSFRMIKNSATLPSPSTFRHRFGSLRNAYDRVGYGDPDHFVKVDSRRRIYLLRQQLISKISAMFPNELSTFRRGGRWRTRLRMSNRLMISLLIPRAITSPKGDIRWQIEPVRQEHKFVTLLARLDANNTSFFDFHVLPGIDRCCTRFRISLSDGWLRRGKRLGKLSRFCEVVKQIASESGLSKRKRSY
jgi:DNA invertase Pin-like site-specific DNA recombinase